MTAQIDNESGFIFSEGTQIVTLREIVGQNGKNAHPRGSVGVVVRSSTDLEHCYRVRFPDGIEVSDPPHVKPLLYVYRVLLTGIHLMRSGEVEANLVRLNETAKLPYIPDLILLKTNGLEKGRLDQADLDFHHREYERLRAELQQAYEVSHLPEGPQGAAALNDLLVRIRLNERRSPTL